MKPPPEVESPPPFEMLARLLRERLRIIADRDWYGRDPDGHLESLRAVSESIDAAAGALPRPVDANLKHYLERRSFEKALAFLEGRSPESHSAP